MLKTALALLGLGLVVVTLLGARMLGTPKSLSEIPITQAFQLDLGRVGQLGGTPTIPPFRGTLPRGVNVAITRINAEPSNSGIPLLIRVNGQLLFRSRFRVDGAPVQHLDPPIIVPEGGTVEIGMQWTSNRFEAGVIIGGYFLTPADLGR